MTEPEYREKLKKIESDYEQAKKDLYIEYGLTNAKYKKGDIIKGYSSIILVDKITVYKNFDLPAPAYHGIELKTDQTAWKKVI
jgi:hypothetical protein